MKSGRRLAAMLLVCMLVIASAFTLTACTGGGGSSKKSYICGYCGKTMSGGYYDYINGRYVCRSCTIYAVAVKSGPSVFNADSKKRQEQNFNAAAKLAQQAKARYEAYIGYCYGKKRTLDEAPPSFTRNWQVSSSGQS